jgi:hypothetical protein
MQPKHFSEVHTEAKVLKAGRQRGSEESCSKEKEETMLLWRKRSIPLAMGMSVMGRVNMSSSNLIRWGGLAALVGSVIGILYFPFHSAAYLSSPQGGADSLAAPWVAAWYEPFARVFDPLLTFASPYDVYTTFGKFSILVVLGYLAGVLALHSRQSAHAGRLEKWGFRVLLIGTALGTVGAFGEYYTPYIDFSFLAFSTPGFFLLMFGSPLFGIGTLRARMTPRLGGWLLTIGGFPGIILMTLLVGHLSGGLLLLDFAWVVLGYSLWRQRGGPAERSPRVR